jgi:hypothetical protein
MTVTISPFLAWFNYAKFKGCSVAVTEPEILTFSPSDTVFDRIDRVVLRLDLSLNKAYFTVLKGVASSRPAIPNITKTEAVNDISPFYVRIRAGATEITPSDITSTILDEKVCGIMRDGVTGIPTAQLQSQAEALILRLHEAITEVQAGSAFMIGEVYDPDNKAKPVAFDDETVKTRGSDLTGYLRNVNHNSFEFAKKERKVNDKLFSVSFGAGASTDYATGTIQLVEVTEEGNKVLGRLDIGAYDLTYKDTNGTKSQVITEAKKPYGTYTGNGTLDIRNIYVGEGSDKPRMLLVVSQYGLVLATSNYSIALDKLSGEIYYLRDVTFHGGNLFIRNSDDVINHAGATYQFQLL